MHTLPTKPQPTFRHRLITDQRVQEPLAKAVKARAKYIQTLAPLMQLLNPDAEVRTLRALIERETDPEIITRASERIHQLKGEGAVAARTRAIVLSRQAFAEFCKALEPLLNAAETVVSELRASATEAEKEFFASHGMDHEPTGLSESVATLSRGIKAERVALANNRGNSHDDARPLMGLSTPARADMGSSVIKFFET